MINLQVNMSSVRLNFDLPGLYKLTAVSTFVAAAVSAAFTESHLIFVGTAVLAAGLFGACIDRVFNGRSTTDQGLPLEGDRLDGLFVVAGIGSCLSFAAASATFCVGGPCVVVTVATFMATLLGGYALGQGFASLS